MKTFFIALYCLLISNLLAAQVKPLVRAHAHNDYEHTHPLKDALSLGFTSVEADVYLIDNELYVSHQYPKQPDSLRTLQKLYLQPLQKLVKANKGAVYNKWNGVFYLMIDVKNDSLNTYKALKRQLSVYPELLHNARVKIYLTSFQDLHFVLNEKEELMGIDGRQKDLGKGYTSGQMPVISESFRTITGWDGKSPVSDEMYKKARIFIDRVHQDGKKCRMWALPDNEAMWKRLYDMGMDFINTDHIEALMVFLNKMY